MSRFGYRDKGDFQALHEIVAAAEANLPIEVWDYLIGGADTETTVKRNRRALDSVAFRPRVLNDVEDIDLSGELFGHRLRLPVFLAPIGSMQDFIPEGAEASARAAERFGTMMMLSSSSSPGLEAVAAATPDHPKIFQIYVRGDEAFVNDHIRRAIDAGYKAFCFTVDLDYYGRRERDLAKRHKTTARSTAKDEHYQSRFSWDDLKRYRERYDIPMIPKGIATAEDAALACEHGIDAVYVSNHGGRQLDHGRGSLDVLPEVVDAVGGRARVLMDGGIYRGTDVIKAIALGADAVGIGRLHGWGAGAAGADGIVRTLELLETEIRIGLGLLGVRSFSELTVDHLCPEEPVGPSDVFSAFPLLFEDY